MSDQHKALNPEQPRLSQRLLEEGAGFALAYAGQGQPWLSTLADNLHASTEVHDAVAMAVKGANAMVQAVADDLAAARPEGFKPVAWAEERIEAPADEYQPAYSVPGITVAQMAVTYALRAQGLPTENAKAVIAHSQGVLAAYPTQGRCDDATAIALAELIGVAMTRQGRISGLIAGNGASGTSPMVAIGGVSKDIVEYAIAKAKVGSVVGLVNSREDVVMVGRPAENAAVIRLLKAQSAKEQKELDDKRRGGTALNPRFTQLEVRAGFHHPDMQAGADQVVQWAERCGIDAELARDAAQAVMVTPVDWPAEIAKAVDAGATWVLDLGPGRGVQSLSAKILRGRGVGSLSVSDSEGQADLFDAGRELKEPLDYSAYLPKVVDVHGQKRLRTKFTELTGQSPMLLAGMTPTTVDAEIVAAAANSGHWAELAGGGQVRQNILERSIEKLTGLLDEGVSASFNAMFLDPKLWGLHIGGRKLVQKARQAGAPIDSIVVSAGMPEPEEAEVLLAELEANGFNHVAFKPGAVNQIRRVLALADRVPETPIIMQVEGGKAGGHHSWEDLDDLLIATYEDIRRRPNVVLCVGGGIGTPERAADYLTGQWSKPYQLPLMPVDGILIGTAAMAAKEAKTSPQVKRALVEAQGDPNAWVPAGRAVHGVASGRSQLGADIHEIENSFAKAGRLLDEVAGDAEAVAKRREEIIAAINKTCKPYFGDVQNMSYAGLIRRYLELSGPYDAEAAAAVELPEEDHGWVNRAWFTRFAELIERTEARLNTVDSGEFEAKVETRIDKDPQETLQELLAAYPAAEDQVLHPADVDWFYALCASSGKPVNFVPVIDQDVRRRWRSDSLWQAHDPRYEADEVCIIPGPAAVAGITTMDEPIAELLDRFDQASIERILETDAEISEDRTPVIRQILDARTTEWAGRQQRSLIHRLGAPDTWQEKGEGYYHPDSGATLEPSASGAVLRVPLTDGELTVPYRLSAGAPGGVVPVVSAHDAEESMAALTKVAAGGQLAEATGLKAHWETQVQAAKLADYATVTTGHLGSDTVHVDAAQLTPDVLVGYAWPAIFSAVRASGAVEGMLSLIHLDHQITVEEDLDALSDGITLVIDAEAQEPVDTEMGRVVMVKATINARHKTIATLKERFLVRGRTGNEPMPQWADEAEAGKTATDTPRSFRAAATVQAPRSMRSFAIVSGDRNPIHVDQAAAALAGLGEPIVHGMWTSAMAQIVAAAGYEGEETTTAPGVVKEWSASMIAPVLPGATVDFQVDRIGVDSRPGYGEIRNVTATVDGQPVLSATATMAAPVTFYAFPGQGIQSQGMGMASRASSAAARAVWDRADKHTREKLGFSVLHIVQDNPQDVWVGGEKFSHPDGVLYLTQFTQVAMATLGVAQVAEMEEAGVMEDHSYFAGHSVGEYDALSAYSGVLSLEAVVEIVYRRGLTMHRLVDRDENGLSTYGLAALRPNKMGLSEDEVFDYVTEMSEKCGEFLEIVNYNIAGVQYAVAGTVKGLRALQADVEKRAPGQRAYIRIPGIDVPFHSSKLRDGVGDFREHLDALLPETFSLDRLIGRYIPNLVARPFELSYEFVESMTEVVDSEIINGILENFEEASKDEHALARTILVELLAWQFASPVRWIETQALALEDLGVQRFIEVGVGDSPTIANMMGQTLRLPRYAGHPIEVLNVERDRPVVFATDEISRALPEPDAEAEGTDAQASASAQAASATATDKAEAPAASTAASAASTAAPAPASTAAPAAPAGGARPDDLPLSAGEATEMLIAVWTKVRPDQMTPTDSIETLVEGVSSRRNQLLLDLGVEFGLGAIDGAADAALEDLKAQVAGLARGYKAFGPVLGEASADALRRLTGPTGKKPTYIRERVTGTWQLGEGWADQVTAALVLGTREGASLRGGDLATLQPANPSKAADLDELIDAAVQAVAAQHGVSVALPSAGGGAGGAVVDSAALSEFAENLTGKDGVLAKTARDLLERLGLQDHADAPVDAGADDRAIVALVERELGADWPKQVAPSFNPDKAVLLDDRWASAREDLSRAVLNSTTDELDLHGAGEAVAAQAEYFGYPELAAQARNQEPLRYSADTAVVTGGSPNSIAASIIAELLHGGATVVATTSSLNHKRLEFYKQLFAQHARGNAALWVAPANLSSYEDLDNLVEWIGSEQTATVNGAKKVLKKPLIPTLLFPFAAPGVSGSVDDAGPQAESQMRLLLWSVERLIAGLSHIGSDVSVGHRLHVVLPGSPNRGRFGGDGAYGESKAALDALVTRWKAEQPGWGERTSLVHAHIGWIRGTGLMGHNDVLVDEVEKAGVRTFSTEEITEKLLSQATPEVRSQAAQAPITVDYTGGLAEAELNLPELARTAREKAEASDAAEAATSIPRTIAALPSIRQPLQWTTPTFQPVQRSLEDMVVMVGVGELSPLGSSRTRFEVELGDTLSAAGVTELAWSMGLISYEDGAWRDSDGEEVPETEIRERYLDEVMAKIGVRQFHDDFHMVDNLAPELTQVYLDRDLTFAAADEAEARSFLETEPETTRIAFDEENEEWLVTRTAGAAVRVPRRVVMTRFVGGQIPEGFDPAVWGIPADMIDNLDRVAVWNLVCTVDAFLSSGFTPADILGAVHPGRVSSTQGTGMGGVQSMRSLYIDGLLAEPRANDILQEALPNVVAAHVMQAYVGGYGQMIHPVAACATAAVSVEEGSDKIRLGKADFVVAGGIDDLSIEGITGFGDMAATADSAEMRAKGIDDRYFSRANDRRRGGFIESEGGGTVLLARGSFAADYNLPVLAVVGYAESFADGAHTSIPAPGLGALGAARGGQHSGLGRSLASLGLNADDIAVISKHDTSTTANDPNESDLHERIAGALGRSEGNPLYVISQKTITGHAKGGAAAFQLGGLAQVLRCGIIPANRSLDCVDPVLRKHEHLVWLRHPLALSGAMTPKAGLVTSLGFGHVSALIMLAHPGVFLTALAQERGRDAADAWQAAARAKEYRGLQLILGGMHQVNPLYQRPQDRNLGGTGDAAKEREAVALLDDRARLVDGVLTIPEEEEKA